MAIIHHSNCPICDSTKIAEVQEIKDHSHTGETFHVVRCENCDFHFTQDTPDASSIAPYYKSDNYVSHSDTQKGIFFKLYHIVRNHMLKKKRNLTIATSGTNAGNLLDIGTGTGYFPDIMKSSGWNVEGIEQDPDTRKYASEKFGFDVYDTDQLFALKKDNYNAISMWHVLEHVHNLNEYVAQIHKLLKKEGVFIVAVPNHTSVDAKYYKEYWAAWDIPIHLWHFHPATMQKLMEKHGFNVKTIQPMPFDAVYVSMLSEQYKSGSKLPGLIKGLKFALNGRFKTEACSSVIYIMEKK